MPDTATLGRHQNQAIPKQRIAAAWIAFAVGVVLGVGWPIAAIVNWSDIVHSDVRLGFLVGDVGLIVPLCFATWHGLRRATWWGPLIFLFFAGAGAYDLIVFTIFLIQVKAFGVPGVVYGVLGAASLIGIAIFTRGEILRDKPLMTGSRD